MHMRELFYFYFYFYFKTYAHRAVGKVFFDVEEKPEGALGLEHEPFGW